MLNTAIFCVRNILDNLGNFDPNIFTYEFPYLTAYQVISSDKNPKQK